MVIDNSIHHCWQAEEYHRNSFIQHNAALRLLEYIQFQGTERVLDVGCGDGKITAQIAATYTPKGSVLGIDVSSEMIDFAQKTFTTDAYKNLKFGLQDAKKLDFNEAFDVIFSSFALQWILDQNSFLKTISSCLKDGGYFIATIPLDISYELEQSIDAGTSLPEWSCYFKDFSKTWHFPNQYEFSELLINNGFVSIRLDVVSEKTIFASRQLFENYVIQWFPYLQPLPQNLRKTFFKTIIDKYLEIIPPLDGGRIIFKFSRLEVIAFKAIV